MTPTREWVFKEQSNKMSTIQYFENVLEPHTARQLFRQLSIIDYIDTGGTNAPSQKWFDVHNRHFCDTWKDTQPTWVASPYTPDILSLQHYVQHFAETNLPHDLHTNINCCLINKYDTGKKQIEPHRDAPEVFGTTPTVISLSLGASRKMIFQRIGLDKQDQNFEVVLHHGSIVVMGGETQNSFTHAIPQDNTNKCRISCTFREKIW